MKKWMMMVVGCLCIGAGLTVASVDPINLNKGWFGEDDYPVKGYDVVAYFQKKGTPVKGKLMHASTYKDQQWLFSSEENKALFDKNPQQYAPQYGGYCAWAVSQGYTAGADPKTGVVYKGKLYLNYDDKVGKKWAKDPETFIKQAETVWQDWFPAR